MRRSILLAAQAGPVREHRLFGGGSRNSCPSGGCASSAANSPAPQVLTAPPKVATATSSVTTTKAVAKTKTATHRVRLFGRVLGGCR